MFERYLAPVVLGVCLIGEVNAQTTAGVDFARDIQPIFRQACIGCHGPAQQLNGLRLDRKSSVFKDGARRVVAGSTENSMLYHRVSGSGYGLQMPPTAPLRAEQIQLIKSWIEQGAEWPDALSNEAELPPVDPKAVAVVEALRNGDRQAFLKAVAENPKILNARGPEGSTPFMYAVLYGDAALLEQLLKKGADPNIRNDAKATALMWAATNLDKTRVLLAHGADVNAMSAANRTPLMIAAGHPGGTPVVKLLLDHGANPNPTRNPNGESSPLIRAALAGDPESIQMLLAKGADAKASGISALSLSITVDCLKCVDLLVKQNLDKLAYIVAFGQNVGLASPATLRLLLDHGAEVNAVDPFGRTPLMYAVVADTIPVETVKLLIERGADVNARSQHAGSVDAGMSVLDIARMQGETPIVDLLVKAGAKSAVKADPAPQPHPAGSVNLAIQRSLPLLQRADVNFTARSGCVSCHNDSFAAMAVGLARQKGFQVDETVSAKQVAVNAAHLQHDRDELHQGFFPAQAGAETVGDTFGPGVLGDILIGLEAEHYKADLSTDSVAMYLKSRQMADGHWAYPPADFRQPICADYFGQTAHALRALQLYAPKVDKAEYDKSIRLAASWLARTEPKTDEDRVWRLMGLAWAGTEKDAMQKALKEVLSLQKPDGGWSDLPTTSSTSYATGQALVALHTAGVATTDAVWKRGVDFLLSTQMEDGSWYIKSRALALQPFFDSGFPHGFDQYISAAGSSWATMALALAAPAAALP